MSETEESLIEAELRLAEGWCPHTQHGRLIPLDDAWGRCDLCDGLWLRVRDRPWLRFRMVNGDRYAEQIVDVCHLAQSMLAADDVLSRVVRKTRDTLSPPGHRGAP